MSSLPQSSRRMDDFAEACLRQNNTQSCTPAVDFTTQLHPSFAAPTCSRAHWERENAALPWLSQGAGPGRQVIAPAMTPVTKPTLGDHLSMANPLAPEVPSRPSQSRQESQLPAPALDLKTFKFPSTKVCPSPSPNHLGKLIIH